jgi:ATP-dependent DNA ligase
MTTTKAFEVLDRLAQMSGRNEKIALLEENRDNTTLQNILRWAYNGDKYHVHTEVVVALANNNSEEVRVSNLVAFDALLTRLKNREVTGGKAEQEVQQLFTAFDSSESKWYLRVMKHDLRTGFTKGTVTKVFGKDFWGSSATESNSYGFPGVMLAEKWDKHKSKYMFKEFYVEPKYDGYRLVAVVDNGQVTFYSRQGKSEPYTTNLTHVAQQIVEAGFDNCMVDGEIMKDSWNGTSVVKKKKMSTEDRENLAKVTFTAFDYIDFAIYSTGDDSYTVPFHERRSQLEDVLAESNYTNLKITDSFKVKSEEEAFDHHARFRKEGKEGTMVKDPNGHYMFNDRNHFWVKIKPVHSIDAKIIDFQPGEAGKKNEHRLGAIICQDAKGIKYKCGQGFEDLDRDYIWENRAKLLGAIIEMEAQDETNSKTGPVATARNAVFLRIREDREGIL